MEFFNRLLLKVNFYNTVHYRTFFNNAGIVEHENALSCFVVNAIIYDCLGALAVTFPRVVADSAPRLLQSSQALSQKRLYPYSFMYKALYSVVRQLCSLCLQTGSKTRESDRGLVCSCLHALDKCLSRYNDLLGTVLPHNQLITPHLRLVLYR